MIIGIFMAGLIMESLLPRAANQLMKPGLKNQIPLFKLALTIHWLQAHLLQPEQQTPTRKKNFLDFK